MTIVVCGDSYNIGIGCLNLRTEPYGCLLSSKLDKPLINLAKGSSTNLSIYLQVKYAVENIKNIDLCIFANTSYDRVEWFPSDYTQRGELKNTDVNYHQYPPYGEHSYKELLPNPITKDYKGKMFTENIRGVIDYYENFVVKKIKSGYYKRFNYEPDDKIKILYDYGINIMDENIDKIKSTGVMVMAHLLCKKNNINHLLLTDEVDRYSAFIDKKNLTYVNWGLLSKNYPDPLNTLHTSAEGHTLVYDQIYNKLIENNWVS